MKFKVACLLVVFALGCGGSGIPGTAPVSGTVTLDGKPLVGANVCFSSEDGKHLGFGRTDDQGKYKLVQGAMVGSNKVFISRTEGELPAGYSDDPESGMDAGQVEAMSMSAPKKGKSNLPKEVIPEIYSSLAKTKLTFNVQSGGNDNVNFEL